MGEGRENEGPAKAQLTLGRASSLPISLQTRRVLITYIIPDFVTSLPIPECGVLRGTSTTAQGKYSADGNVSRSCPAACHDNVEEHNNVCIAIDCNSITVISWAREDDDTDVTIR